jgi:phosphatidylglycerol:prolipoprotein diacylglycerol transferase
LQPEIGPIKTFGVMFAFGFLAAGAIVARRLKELGKPVDWAYEIVFAALAGGLVGSRLWYLLAHTSQFSDDPLGSAFGGTGLVWYGGAIGGAVAVLAWAWRRDFLGITLLDVCAVPLAVGYAIGRIGCQISGDGDYGEPSDLPWAMAYPHGTVPTTDEVHPTPIYETLSMGLLAYALWILRDRVRPGVLFAGYLAGAGVERFLVEFVRRNEPVLIGLTEAQLLSVAMAAAGAVWLARIRARHGSLRTDERLQADDPALAT